MVKKVVNILIVCAIILAIWKLSGGDVGAFLLSVWHGVLFPIVDFTSNIIITFWNAFLSIF